MRFKVLGPISVARGSRALDLGGPKQRTVLAMLVANAGERVSADVIVEGVYGEDVRPNARRIVQTYVSALRAELGDVIEKARGGWRLRVEPGQVDALEFTDIVESVHGAVDMVPERASERLRDALALWRGHPYADVDAHGALEAEIARLSELRLAAQAARIDADLLLGLHAELIAEIEALVIEHPYQERFRAQQMLALYRSGRQREALRAYEEIQATLREELGLDPSPELQELEVRVLNQDPGLLEVSRRRIERRAILVVYPGDPIRLSRSAEPGDGKALLAGIDALLGTVADDDPDLDILVAGSARYAVLDSPDRGADIATSIASSFPASPPRMAIDWGEIERSGGVVSGPPVSRAAKLVSLAKPGQALLSLDAQREIVESGRAGHRFESLGSLDLPGLEGSTSVYQVLVPGQTEQHTGFESDLLPPPLPGAGLQSVPGYEVREQIGQGSVGDLYTGYQPVIGREVLIEVIPQTVSSDSKFLRAFETDVQRLSLFDHPNIATVLDYWREPSGAYIVYPAHRGGPLYIDDAPDAARLLSQVGSALSYAHSHGVVHGGLHPGNVFLDESGNANLLGFRIGGLGTGPPPEYSRYVADEVARGDPPSPAADIYSLGMLASDLIQTTSRSDGPTGEQVTNAIGKALDPSPSNRQQSVSQLMVELNPEGLDSPEARFTHARNPFKGLAAFQEVDAGDFFGREHVVDEIVDLMRDEMFLLLVGPSGSGKSSVVRAGVIPRIGSGALDEAGEWFAASMTPGSDPFVELRQSLERVAVHLPSSLTSALAAADADALREVSECLPGDGRLVLFIDQFEELFTISEPQRRIQFIDLLATTVADGYAGVLITLRADYLDRPLGYSQLAELLDGRTLTLGSMTRTELADAVVRPARAVGVEVDPGLVERVVADLHDEPGALPLLQQAMMELFETRQSDLLTLEEYESVGGMRGALARRAEMTFAALGAEGQRASRQLFLRLVAVSEDGPPGRQRVRVVDLEGIDSVEDILARFTKARLLVLDTDTETRVPTVEVAHEALLAHWPRLAGWIDDAREDLIFSRRLDEAVSEWELSGRSEAYLLAGSRLAQYEAWASESTLALSPVEQDFLEASRTRADEVRLRRRRVRRGLVAGFGLAAVVSMVFGLVALQNAEEARQNAELARENELAALAAEQSALQSEQEAQANAEAARASAAEARQRELEASAEALAQAATATMSSDPELSLLLGLQALQTHPVDTAESVVHQALQEHRSIFRQPLGQEPEVSGTLSPDGRLLVLTDSADQLQVWNVADDTMPLWTMTPPEGLQVETPVFTDDSAQLVVPIAVRTIGLVDPQRAVRFSPPEPRTEWPDGTGFHIYDSRTGDLLRVVPLPSCYFSLMGFPGRANGGRLLLRAAIADGDECVFTNGNFVELGHFDLDEAAFDVHGIVSSVSPPEWTSQSEDGRYVFFAEAETHKLIDTVSGELVLERESRDGAAPIVSNDGSMMIEGRASGSPARLVDVETGELLGTFAPGAGQLVFSSDDSLVAGGDSGDGIVYVWETKSGHLSHRLRTTGTDQRLIHISDDSARVAAFGSVGIVHEIGEEMISEDPEFAFPSLEVGFIPRTPRGLDVSGDVGVASAVPGGAGGPDFWDPPYLTNFVFEVGNGDREREWLGHIPTLSPDATLVASQPFLEMVEVGEEIAGEGRAGLYRRLGPVEIHEPLSGKRIAVVEGMCSHLGWPAFDARGPDCSDGDIFEWVTSLEFSPNGEMLAMIGGINDTLMVWRVPDGALLWSRESGFTDPGSRLLHFSPDSATLVLMDDDNGMVIKTEDGSEADRFEVDTQSFGAVFSPDGSRFYVGDLNSNILVFETEDWERVGVLRGQGGAAISDVALNPHGERLATAGNDGAMWLWDVEEERVLLKIRLSDSRLQNVEWLDDDRLLVGSTREAIVVILDSAELMEAVRSRLTRSFTPEECATYSIVPCPTLEELASAG